MTRYTLDTGVLSRLMRRDEGVVQRVASLASGDRVSVSAIVRGEVRYGIARLPPGKRRRALEVEAEKWLTALEEDVVSAEAADRYGPLKRAAEERGRALAENDLWIAAVALATASTLVTSDGDFGGLPQLVVEIWSSAPR